MEVRHRCRHAPNRSRRASREHRGRQRVNALRCRDAAAVGRGLTIDEISRGARESRARSLAENWLTHSGPRAQQQRQQQQSARSRRPSRQVRWGNFRISSSLLRPRLCRHRAHAAAQAKLVAWRSFLPVGKFVCAPPPPPRPVHELAPCSPTTLPALRIIYQGD